MGGPVSARFENPNQPQTRVEFTVSGTYVFRLTANDSQFSVFDEVTVVVATANNPPTISPYVPVSVVLPTSLAVQANASDDGHPNGTLTCSWSKLSGPGTVIFANPSAASTTVSFTRAGPHVIQLAASDSELVTTRSFTIQVRDPGDQGAFVAAGCDFTAVAGAATMLPGLIDTAQPLADINARWEVWDGPGTVTFGNPAQPNTAATFNAPGVYRLALNADDSAGAHYDDVFVTVLPPTGANQPPRIQLPPPFWVFHSTNAVPLRATLEDDGLPASTLAWQWQQTGGPAAATLLTPSGTGAVPQTSVTFPAPGAYTFSLTASDSALGATNTLEVRVVDLAAVGTPIGYAQPVVNAGPDATVPVGTPYTLQGATTETGWPKWTVVSGPEQVTFPSGPYGIDAVVMFSHPGAYRLRLTSDGSFLGLVSDDVVITVTGAGSNRAPVVDAGPSTNLFLPSASTVLTGSFTDDGFPTGGNVTIEWTLDYGDTEVTIADPNSLTTAVTFDGVADFIAGYHDYPAWYWFTLRISDGELTGEAYVYVQVADPADGWVAPTVYDAGPDRTVPPGSVVQLQADAQSGNPYFPPYVEWQQVAGPHWATMEDWWSETPRVHLDLPGAYTFRAIVWADLMETDTVTFTVTNGNAVPFVDAGGPQAIPFPQSSATVLAGTALDDGQPQPLTVAWTQVSGPTAARLTEPAALQTEVHFAAEGTYVFRLTASDGVATTASEVTVNAYLDFNFFNRPPVVNAGSDIVTSPGATVVTFASITDDGTVDHSWTQISGPAPASLSSVGVAYPNVRIGFTAPGQYVFRLTASDSVYAAGDEVVITVLAAAANAAPRVQYRTDGLPVAGAPALLRLVIADDCHPDNTGLSADWQWGDGPGDVVFGSQTFTPLPGGNATEWLAEATFSLPGAYWLGLRVSDGSQETWLSFTVAVLPARSPNDPPLAEAGPDQTVVTASPFNLAGAVSDDGQPAGGAASASWSLASGPGPAYFQGAAATSVQAQVHVPGVYVFRLTASDGEQTAVDDVTITAVAPANQPPFVFAGNDFSVTRPNVGSLQGLASDDGRPAGYPLVVEWSQISGPPGVAIAARTTALTTAAFPTAGAYVLRLTAFDGQYSTTDDVSVTVIEGTNAPPVVNAGADFAALVNTPATLSGTATDDGLPNGYLQSAWSQVSGPGTARFTTLNGAYRVTADTEGTYVLRLSATDGALSAADDVTLTVHASVPPPVVEITAPLDAGEVTAPTVVLGTATSPLLASWTLEWRLKPADSDSSSSSNWTTLATATTNVLNNTLGLLDPTLALNGLYELRLTATDQIGRSASTEPVTVIFDRNMKIGHFAFSFNDLTIPVAGIPITITRSYDSRNKQQGDFGIGWTLDLANIRVQKNRNLGRNWQQTSTGGDFPVYAVETARPRVVTITFPNGKVYRFGAVPEPSAQFAFPISYPRMTFVPLPGTYGTLTPVFLHHQSGERIVDDWTIFPTPIPGTGDLISFELLIDPPPGPADNILWNPAMFEFTTQEGYTYLVSETNGLHQVTDPNGNTLTITTNGVTHSSGKSVVFERDDLGRITNIVDAAGHAMRYTYDANGDLAQFIDRSGNTNTFSYDGRHNLLNVTDARGITPASNEYDVSGRLVRHIDAFGKVVDYTHNLSDRQEVLTDRLGNVSVHEYDEHGNVVSTTAPDGGVTLSTYDTNDNLLNVTDPLGRRTTYTYDAEDNRTSVTDPLGNTTRLTYGPKRRVSSVTDPRGNTITNVFDAAGNLLSMTDPIGHATTFGYNAQGLPVAMTNVLGQVTTWQYNEFGHILRETDPTGRVNVYANDVQGNPLSMTTTRTTPGGPQSLTFQFTYDALNRLTNVVFPDGSTTATLFNEIGRTAVTIDQLGRQTRREYDDLGRVVRVLHPDGTADGSAYDDEGRLVAITNRLGQVTMLRYDGVGRLTGAVYPDGTTTTNYFDLGSQLIAATDARGFTTFYGYDLGGRTVAVTNALGEVSRTFFDAAGNVTNVVDNLGRGAGFIYDALNRRVQTIFANGTTQNAYFDPLGRQVAATDQAGTSTWFGYDALSRLTSVTNALGHVTRYAYDELGELLSQTDANNHVTAFEYDALGRRIKRTLPGGQGETYAYNVAGLLTGRTDFNGYTTTYQYDAMNRLLARVPDARLGQAAVTFTYNALGLRESMTDASGVTIYQYDVRSWLVQKATPQGTLTYTRDANGNITSIRSSNPNGTDVAYGYDIVNRLSAVNDARLGRTSYTYDGVGNLRGFTHPNGVNSFHEYDSLNRLTNLTASTVLNTLAQYRYTVGPAGNRLTASETVVPNGVPTTINRLYQYDALYRLTGEQITGSSAAGLSYQYDSVGNRLARISNLPVLPSQAFGYDANNRLLSDQYDANGNTVVGRVSPGAPLVADRYDFEDRLISRNNGQVTVVYDGDGNRVRKTVGGLTTHYLVDDLNPTGYAQVVEELTSAGGTPVVTRVYTYGHDLLAQDQVTGPNWQASFYGYDGMGSVRYLTDLNGLITDTYDYDAYGNLIASTGSTSNHYLYRGEQFDPDLGLYYLRARYHNPDTGRFWTADTFEGFGSDPATLHRYTFCGNNPINSIDPSGNQSLAETTTVFGIGVNTRFLLGTLAGYYVGGAYGAYSAYRRGDDVLQGFATGALSGALFGGLLGPVPPAFWTSTLGKASLAALTVTGLSQAAVSASEGYPDLAAIEAVFAVAPWALSSRQLAILLGGRFSSRTGLVVQESAGASVVDDGTVVASAATRRSLTTAIRADVAESTAYNEALLRGEIGLQRPGGSNVPGSDFITAALNRRTGQIEIIITDVKSSTVGRFPTPQTAILPTWLAEAQAAINRLKLPNSEVENAIRAALAAGRVRLRQLNVNYSSSPQGQGRIQGF